MILDVMKRFDQAEKEPRPTAPGLEVAEIAQLITAQYGKPVDRSDIAPRVSSLVKAKSAARVKTPYGVRYALPAGHSESKSS
jgi:hypothetical protein